MTISVVTPRQVGDYLGETDPSTRRLAVQLAEQVEAFFLTQLGRAGRPFELAAQEDRVDVLNGTGTSTLYLPYPIADLTSVVLGYDSTNPLETLDVANQSSLRWTVGSRRLARVSWQTASWGPAGPDWVGRAFGPQGAPGFVTVTYDAQGETIPEEFGLAVLRLLSTIWSQIGNEGVIAERIGGYSQDFGKVVEGDSFWQAVVDQHRERTFV